MTIAQSKTSVPQPILDLNPVNRALYVSAAYVVMMSYAPLRRSSQADA